LPVTTIDGRPVGKGVPGPVTRRLMALYDELARRGVD
jgi:branched-chain amino acid aminotransferase